MKPKGEWGSHLWAFVHTICAHPQHDIVDLLKQVTRIIPCPLCRFTWQEHVDQLGPHSSFEGMFEWSVWIHNLINQKLNKPMMTLEDATERWIVRIDQKVR